MHLILSFDLLTFVILYQFLLLFIVVFISLLLGFLGFTRFVATSFTIIMISFIISKLRPSLYPTSICNAKYLNLVDVRLFSLIRLLINCCFYQIPKNSIALKKNGFYSPFLMMNQLLHHYGRTHLSLTSYTSLFLMGFQKC